MFLVVVTFLILRNPRNLRIDAFEMNNGKLEMTNGKCRSPSLWEGLGAATAIQNKRIRSRSLWEGPGEGRSYGNQKKENLTAGFSPRSASLISSNSPHSAGTSQRFETKNEDQRTKNKEQKTNLATLLTLPAKSVQSSRAGDRRFFHARTPPSD